MTLRVNDFSNRFGDVYSLGGLDIARDDANGRSALIENVSGTLESDGNMRLLADTLSNRRDQFTTEKPGFREHQCLRQRLLQRQGLRAEVQRRRNL